MKNKFIFITFVVFALTFSNHCMAAPDTVKVVVNGNVLVSDTPAVIRNSRTMVPFRALFEALGANQIYWDEPTQTVVGSDGTTTVKLVIGSYDMNVNGVNITMDTPPMIINSRTMIPLSAVSSSLGASVNWDSVGYVASVTKVGVISTQSSPIQEQVIIPDFSNIKNTQSSDTAQISGYYAIEDLKRNKYVLNLDANQKAELTNISTKAKNQGTYSYNASNLSLNVGIFNSSYTREDIKYNNNNIIFMKDNANPTSGSTFAMLKISQEEYNKYLDNK